MIWVHDDEALVGCGGGGSGAALSIGRRVVLALHLGCHGGRVGGSRVDSVMAHHGVHVMRIVVVMVAGDGGVAHQIHGGRVVVMVVVSVGHRARGCVGGT